MKTPPLPPSAFPESDQRPSHIPRQATWSLFFGILSMTCLWLLAAIPAIILAIQSIRKVQASGGSRKDHGLAVAGLLMGIAGIFVGWMVWLPAGHAVRYHAQSTKETHEMKQVLLACFSYAANHNDQFPDDLSDLAGSTENAYLTEEMLYSSMSGKRFLYRPGLTGFTDSNRAEVFLASPEPIRSNRIVAHVVGSIQQIPESQFQEKYARYFE